MIDYEKTVLPFYYEIGVYQAKIGYWIRESEGCARLIKHFENQLEKYLEQDAKTMATYPDIFTDCNHASCVSSLLAVIDEQHKKIVEANREIERLYFKLSDTVKAAKAAESEYYKLSA